MPQFTDRLLASLKGKDKRYTLWEENHRRLGTLGVRVSQSGRRTWIFMYRFANKPRMATLGIYPMMSVAAAHAAAGELMKTLEQGRDPTRERIEARLELKRAPTVAQLVKDYIEKYAKRHKTTWENDELMLNKHIVPKLGHLKAVDVRRRDLIGVLEDIALRAPTSANRVLEMTRKMYNWAVEREICEYNPCYNLSKPSPENQRERVLSPKEIRQLWHLLDADEHPAKGTPAGKDSKGQPTPWISRPVRLALKLALVTAQRRVEVAGAARSEFELTEDWWEIPGERAKNGKPHRVPLSGLAKAIVQELNQLGREETAWLVPSCQGEEDEPVNARALTCAIARLRKVAKMAHFTVHDLRRTAASEMAGLGVSRTVIRKVLNHTDPEITAIYDRYRYMAEKRAALEGWAQRLREIIEASDESALAVAA